MRVFHLQFNKEADGCWYIDFPGYPFAHHNLMMVAGADKLCQYIAEKEGHPNKAVVDVTTGKNFLQERIPDILMERYDKGYGAWYHNTTPERKAPTVRIGERGIDVSDAWICPVTLLVLYGYPKQINIYIPNK